MHLIWNVLDVCNFLIGWNNAENNKMTSNFADSKKEMRDGTKVISIDTKKATFKGQKWQSLSDFQKRKLDNLVFLNNAKDRPKIIYN